MPPSFFGWPWMAPFSGAPQTANYLHFPCGGGQGQSTSSSLSGNPGPSGVTTQTARLEEESQPEDDVVQLLDQDEALELIEFDPTVDSKDTWKPPQAIQAFLEKHFNRSLSEEERSAIMKDFLKP